jgi:acyl-coenzyme A synthetase/AMP-(fatty) acid ligase
LPGVAVFGLGLSATVAPLTDTVISAVRDERSGIASAVNNVASRIANLLAVAAVGAIVALVFSQVVAETNEALSLSSESQQTISEIEADPTGGLKANQLPPEAKAAVKKAYTHAFQWAMITNALLAAAGGLVAFVTIRDASDEEEQGKEDS